jgi:hypothetical protein
MQLDVVWQYGACARSGPAGRGVGMAALGVLATSGHCATRNQLLPSCHAALTCVELHELRISLCWFGCSRGTRWTGRAARRCRPSTRAALRSSVRDTVLQGFVHRCMFALDDDCKPNARNCCLCVFTHVHLKLNLVAHWLAYAGSVIG